MNKLTMCALVFAGAQAHSLNQEKLYSLMQLESDPICSSAGCDQYKHPEAPEDPPRDYFVPNFGHDPDMVSTLDHEA